MSYHFEDLLLSTVGILRNENELQKIYFSRSGLILSALSMRNNQTGESVESNSLFMAAESSPVGDLDIGPTENYTLGPGHETTYRKPTSAYLATHGTQ